MAICLTNDTTFDRCTCIPELRGILDPLLDLGYHVHTFLSGGGQLLEHVESDTVPDGAHVLVTGACYQRVDGESLRSIVAQARREGRGNQQAKVGVAMLAVPAHLAAPSALGEGPSPPPASPSSHSSTASPSSPGTLASLGAPGGPGAPGAPTSPGAPGAPATADAHAPILPGVRGRKRSYISEQVVCQIAGLVKCADWLCPYELIDKYTRVKRIHGEQAARDKLTNWRETWTEQLTLPTPGQHGPERASPRRVMYPLSDDERAREAAREAAAAPHHYKRFRRDLPSSSRHTATRLPDVPEFVIVRKTTCLGAVSSMRMRLLHARDRAPVCDTWFAALVSACTMYMDSRPTRKGAAIDVRTHPDVDAVVLGAPSDTLAELLCMSRWIMRYMVRRAQFMTEQFNGFRECEHTSHRSWRSIGFGEHSTFVYSQWLAGFASSFIHYGDEQWTRDSVEDRFKNECFNPFGVDVHNNRKLSFLHGCFFAMGDLQRMLRKYEQHTARGLLSPDL